MRLISISILLSGWGVVAAANGPLTTLEISDSDVSSSIAIQDSGGWVNPEHLPPMPQCIAQQDTSLWLRALTTCTGRRCTRHFGVICTHHQWLTEFACLSTSFSPEVIKEYMPLCGRSILAKAQLYQWVRGTTGRTWLVQVGDANGLQELSPASLTEGYASLDVMDKAPTCLTTSHSALTAERFDHAIATCIFKSTVQHTGNAARPWEYNERLHSMIALDSETAGYSLAHPHQNISSGDYFDKKCFCSAFNLASGRTPCSTSESLDLTKEQLWMKATCGPNSIPTGMTPALRTTEFAYIPVEKWHWPKCLSDMPKYVTELPDQCTTDACEQDADGYCNVRRAIDRACFCHNITFDSCGGSCQLFETRIDYGNWLHTTCDSVPNWQGPQKPWTEILTPTPQEMIPWRWTVQPGDTLNSNSTRNSTETYMPDEWKFGSLIIMSAAAYVAVRMGISLETSPIASKMPQNLDKLDWQPTGVIMAAIQLFAHWVNAAIVQSTLGYRYVPIGKLTLFWCTMPRSTWLFDILMSLQQPASVRSYSVLSSLVTESAFQVLSFYYMTTTVKYGLEHGFYFGRLDGVERGGAATMMYAGALIWLMAVMAALAQLMRTWRGQDCHAESDGFASTNTHFTRLLPRISSPLDERVMPSYEQLKLHTLHKGDEHRLSEHATLLGHGESAYNAYGTITLQRCNDQKPRPIYTDLYTIVVYTLCVLWIAQWLFWVGYIALSSTHYCPPRLGFLTVIWVASLMMSTFVRAKM